MEGRQGKGNVDSISCVLLCISWNLLAIYHGRQWTVSAVLDHSIKPLCGQFELVHVSHQVFGCFYDHKSELHANAFFKEVLLFLQVRFWNLFIAGIELNKLPMVVAELVWQSTVYNRYAWCSWRLCSSTRSSSNVVGQSMGLGLSGSEWPRCDVLDTPAETLMALCSEKKWIAYMKSKLSRCRIKDKVDWKAYRPLNVIKKYLMGNNGVSICQSGIPCI